MAASPRLIALLLLTAESHDAQRTEQWRLEPVAVIGGAAVDDDAMCSME